VRVARVLDILGRWERSELGQEDAAGLLGVSDQTQNGTTKFAIDNDLGLSDGARDRRPSRSSGQTPPFANNAFIMLQMKTDKYLYYIFNIDYV
jgi:hypothetical protein